MDITKNEESIENANLILKEEKEFIVSDWLPTKLEDEENQYYQDFADECTQNMSQEIIVKNENICEQFTIEYIDESEYHVDDDYDDDDYAESDRDDTSLKSDSDENDNYTECNLDWEHFTENNFVELENPQAVVKAASSGSKVLDKVQFNRWIADNYINRKCPVCNANVTNYIELRRHITLNHKESLEDSESNYYFSSDNCGICKKCNQEFSTDFSRYIHSAKHIEDVAKLSTYLCRICNFNSKRFPVQNHILEKHPEVINEFKASSSLRNLKCPLCSNTYIRNKHLWHHFMDKHPHEYKAKLRYNCHLCKQVFFTEEKLFLQHLIEEHELNSWTILNYRKVFEDKEYFACTKCNRLFFQNDTYKLLSHSLNHENNFYWSCKFCCQKFCFKKLPVSHMCDKMLRYYEKHYNEVHANNIKKIPEKTELKIKSLQEFEKHITHICPFCNKEFSKMLKWQHHLRTHHKIDTLKGLEMKVIINDSNKLSCIICHTVVVNSPEQLHAHRFQHLPYKAYKCLLCAKTLSTFKTAVNHVSMRCEDDVLVNKADEARYDIWSILDIQCSSCNYQKFHDLKSVFKHYEDKHNYFQYFFIKRSDNSINCKICHKQYVQYEKNVCFMHLQQHFDEKTFKCKLCLRSYPTFKSLSTHLLEIHNAKPLNNQSNENNTDKMQIFLNKQDKITNVSNLPQLGKSSIKSHVLNEFGEFISYACPECNEGMTTQQNWHTHIRTQHNFFDESNLYIRRADASLKCPTCSITVDTRTLQQQKHKLTHMPYRSFMCNLCYARFNSLGVLYGHFRRKHFAQGTFRCPICAVVLKTEHQRAEHIKKTHSRKAWPDSMCLICYKVLSNKGGLNKHMDTHNGDRFRYTCDVCGSKILDLKDFNAHMDRHKMRNETKEKMGDDVTSQSQSKCDHSNDTDDNDQNKSLEKHEHVPEHLNKRKTLTKSPVPKKKEN